MKLQSPTEQQLDLLEKELELSHVYLPNIEGISRKEIVKEIWFSLNPEIHERQIPPYGAIVCSPEGSHEIYNSHTRGSSTSLDRDLVLQAANGTSSFALRLPDTIHLIAFNKHMGTELDLSNLSERVKGLVIQRNQNGTVRIYSAGFIHINEGRRWWSKRSASSIWLAIHNQVQLANRDILQSLLKLALHVLSPSNTGATLVWQIIPSHEAWSTTGTSLTSLELHVTEPGTFPTVAHILAQYDGATLIGDTGKIISTGIHLQPTEKAIELIKEYRGTRHTSAKRFSYDKDEVIIITVSEDGPVTIFSDGVNIGNVDRLSAYHLVNNLAKAKEYREDADRFQTDVAYETCSRCGKHSRIQISYVYGGGWNERLTARCPVCREHLMDDKCFEFDIQVVKNLQK